jgi:diguanylate cyclase (GGDEF)-like protein
MLMESMLQTENQHLRNQLQNLLAEARLNEQKMLRFDQLERCLIKTRSLGDLIEILLSNYKNIFDHDAVTLVLIDPEYEISRILGVDSRAETKISGLALLDSSAALIKLFGENFRPFLSVFDASRHSSILDPSFYGCSSVAFLPLMSQDQLFGSLILGSYTAERFASCRGTDFLERLANIFAICLENALNHDRLKQMGFTDPLTGVNNRRYFESRCLEEVNHAIRHQEFLTCLFLDADHFKKINDSFGHLSGDKVLQKVAQLIKAQLRADDVLARYGGEEFIVLLPHTAVSQAVDIAERIRASIESSGFQSMSGEPIKVTVSIGISVLPTEISALKIGELTEELINTADTALLQAKNNGRNQVIYT